ncbi:hypothetical protein CN601_17195 [Bacillus sp. AFS017336]|nr:hypothetical protein CN601_17195 [Bacillus sp. AFS017336]
MVSNLPNTITLEQKAYEEIKKLIIQGKYAPGTYMTEAALVKDLGMSRTPIRRALVKLETTGFVKHHTNQGSMVQSIQITMIEIVNFLEFRLFLGIGSIEKAKRKILDFPITEMHDCIQEMKTAVTEEEHDLYYLEANHFHNLILRTSQNDLMMETIDNLQKRFEIISSKYYSHRKITVETHIKKYEELTRLFEEKQYDLALDLYNEIIKEIIQSLF